MTDTSSDVTKSYLAYVDGLRGISVAAVVAYHCGLPSAGGGFVGVDVFFVISGFLITRILCTEIEQTGSINLKVFFARRVRRLFPSLLFVLFCTLILSALLLSPMEREVQEVGRAAIAASLFSSNLYFAWWLHDYFGGPSEFQPLLHTWSLGVEEQFYIFWPFLIMLAGALARRLKARFHNAGLLTVIVVMSGSFIAAMGYRDVHPQFVFFWTPFRAWEFGVGAVLAFWPAKEHPFLTRTSNGLAVSGLAAIFLSVLTIAPGPSFPAPLALIPTIGTGLIILAHQITPRLVVDRLLTAAPILWMGRISYAWYLWHFPLLSIAKLRLLERDPVRDTAIGLLSLFLAAITVRCIEGPLRFVVLPRFRSGAVLAGGVACSAGMAGIAVAVGLWAQSIALTKTGDSGQQSVASASAPSTTTAKSRIFIMGDSHAGHLMPALNVWSATRAGSADVFLLMTTACVPLRSVTPIVAGYKQTDCPRSNDTHYATIDASTNVRNESSTPLNVGVVLAARWTMYTGRPNISVYEPWVGSIDESVSSPNAKPVLLEETLRSEIRKFASKSIRVLLVLSPPELKFHLSKCLQRISAEKCATSKSVYLSHQAAIREIAAKLGREFPDQLRVFDPAKVFCPSEVCEVLINDHEAYGDSNHLSEYGAIALLPSLGPLLDWVSRLDPR